MWPSRTLDGCPRRTPTTSSMRAGCHGSFISGLSRRGVPLGELRLSRGADIEQWFDDTDLVWPPEVRSDLYEQVPKTLRDLPTIPVGGDLPTVRDRAVEALVAANDPPIFFRRGGLVTEI